MEQLDSIKKSEKVSRDVKKEHWESCEKKERRKSGHWFIQPHAPHTSPQGSERLFSRRSNGEKVLAIEANWKTVFINRARNRYLSGSKVHIVSKSRLSLLLVNSCWTVCLTTSQKCRLRYNFLWLINRDKDKIRINLGIYPWISLPWNTAGFMLCSIGTETRTTMVHPFQNCLIILAQNRMKTNENVRERERRRREEKRRDPIAIKGPSLKDTIPVLLLP